MTRLFRTPTSDSPIDILPSFRPSRPLLDQVHLAHDVHTWYFKSNHATHGTEHTTEVFCRVLHELGFKKVDGDERDVHSCCEELGEARKDGNVSVEFDLSWAVDDEL